MTQNNRELSNDLCTNTFYIIYGYETFETIREDSKLIFITTLGVRQEFQSRENDYETAEPPYFKRF